MQKLKKIKQNRFDALRRVRKPIPPPTRQHSTKKGDKGYNRGREKEMLRKELGW